MQLSEVEVTAPKKLRTKYNQGRYTCRQVRDNGGKDTSDSEDLSPRPDATPGSHLLLWALLSPGALSRDE